MITMADVYRHRRMCTAKRKRFHSAVEGQMYLLRRKFNQLRIYACPYCNGFHMTKSKYIRRINGKRSLETID